ncbi:peptide chain release factor-like protein [Penicillium hispanicum]|uniref:peptide chain release factor-like protein n=1 Tax=Penicillium hispanicum TaxID=1080232 RepID=UPI00253FBE6B|nr:peptide chain release factor-like protein [Penicillium hispanicum]KAJ5570214.1 peptide chain release factor-like protein [Penicillium hispanicum]
MPITQTTAIQAYLIGPNDSLQQRESSDSPWPSMLRLWTRASRALQQPYCIPIQLSHRTFSHTVSLPAKPLPPRLKIDDADLTVSYLKGTGPGGQKINKTNSAVQIIHGPSGVVVKCQATRSRSQNEKIARQLLADKVEQQEKGDESRVSLKAAAARKKKASKVKKARRKYRSLESEGQEQEAEVDGDVEVEREEEEVGVEEKSVSERTRKSSPST